MNYQAQIVATQEHCTFLHRTCKTLVDSIMQEGLGCGTGDLLGTATWQPQDLHSAERVYKRNHGTRDAVIVIHIPREKVTRTNKYSLAATKGIGYFHPTRKEFTIRPEFVSGWIDKTNDEYHPNPYSNRQPVKGFEQFEHLFEE